MTREEAVALIRGSGLSDGADALIGSLRPAVRLTATPVEQDDLPIGASRMGGLPDLPLGFGWPEWLATRQEWDAKARQMRKLPPARERLDFLAQINLADVAHVLPDSGLPATGSLLFFYDGVAQPWGFDPADRGGARVAYVDVSPEGLRRGGRQRDDFSTKPCRLTPSLLWTIDESLGSEDPDDWDAIDSLRERLGLRPDEGLHHVLGHPQPVQGDMQLQCQLVANGLYCGNASGYNDPRRATLEPGAADWRLLLQIDTDEHGPGWMWGDCGRIYLLDPRAGPHHPRLRCGLVDSAVRVIECLYCPRRAAVLTCDSRPRARPP